MGSLGLESLVSTMSFAILLASIVNQTSAANIVHPVNIAPAPSAAITVVVDRCDLFQGSWVYDDSYPLYNASACPFIEHGFDCQGNGRPDNLYQKYKWKPSACILPRFNGLDFLSRMRGKKILFVGDSLSLNQWQSLTCMLQAAVPQSAYIIRRRGDLSIFDIPDYEISVRLLRNGFLVDVVHEKIGKVLELDSIVNGDSWKGYDMLIFNSWHWWLHEGTKQPWDYIRHGDTLSKDMDRVTAFKVALTTWSKWVDANINPNITKVFFQGLSPVHANGSEWFASSRTTCKGETQPLSGSTYPAGLPLAAIAEKEVLNAISTKATLLDITNLSQLRKDGHPSIYGFDGKKGNDCSHWCLAGVPDTWNELLYAFLVDEGKYKWISEENGHFVPSPTYLLDMNSAHSQSPFLHLLVVLGLFMAFWAPAPIGWS